MAMQFYASPEQIMRDRSEYARKGIARGRSVVVLTYAGGVLFVAENLSTTLHKVSEIYDRIGFAAVGRYNEYENLRSAGIRMADLRGYSYARRDVTARALANAYSATLGAIFGGGGLGRYLVEGIAQRDEGMIFGGVVLVAGLALAVEWVFVLGERALPHSIMVNSNGERFANEALAYDQFGAIMREVDPETGTMPNATAWLIFDQNYWDKFGIPDKQPSYIGADIESWWIDPQKEAALAARYGCRN